MSGIHWRVGASMPEICSPLRCQLSIVSAVPQQPIDDCSSSDTNKTVWKVHKRTRKLSVSNWVGGRPIGWKKRSLSLSFVRLDQTSFCPKQSLWSLRLGAGWAPASHDVMKTWKGPPHSNLNIPSNFSPIKVGVEQSLVEVLVLLVGVGCSNATLKMKYEQHYPTEAYNFRSSCGGCSIG